MQQVVGSRFISTCLCYEAHGPTTVPNSQHLELTRSARMGSCSANRYGIEIRSHKYDDDRVRIGSIAWGNIGHCRVPCKSFLRRQRAYTCHLRLPAERLPVDICFPALPDVVVEVDARYRAGWSDSGQSHSFRVFEWVTASSFLPQRGSPVIEVDTCATFSN